MVVFEMIQLEVLYVFVGELVVVGIGDGVFCVALAFAKIATRDCEVSRPACVQPWSRTGGGRRRPDSEFLIQTLAVTTGRRAERLPALPLQ
ncbi:unnamed protein product [Danaus chrysippus]|uniref:(African queen) hypothetical protein n=1 Tax=Danaus chrysippus TaxID=151541 RepID=A0A8J2VVE0_9NEOP|nr:unnamed protein product [Danaus chrysippus]